jgi:Ca2+-binding RTX toxin-like protein
MAAPDPLEGPVWPSDVITYSFADANLRGQPAQFSSFITEAAYQRVVENAAAAWSAVSGVQFELVPDAASVDIRVGFDALNPAQTSQIGLTYWHSSAQFFLPNTIVLIEDPSQDALIPLAGGDFQYTGYTANLQQVLEHELGHALGLDHNLADPDAVMNPTAGPANSAGPDQSDIEAIQSLYGAPPGTPAPGIAVLDTTTNQSIPAVFQPYTGPVSGLQDQYLNIASDSLNISVSTPNWFLHSGSGNDALAVSSGTNVLDGGTGSNFLSGGSGTDTFFVDDRGPTADIWSTVNGFHAGDVATIWGVTPQDFGLAWVDGQGTAGYTGLTLHATAAGQPTASLTLAGFAGSDLSDGRLSVSFGTDPGSGSPYMYVYANS